jgi:hypothetical protein
MMRCQHCDEMISEVDPVHVCTVLNQQNDQLDSFFKKQKENEVNLWRAEIIKNIRDVKVCLENEDCEAALEIINQMLGED